MKSEEISIKVPWGWVVAKVYGDNQNPHVLSFHGAHDNAASFDRLIKNLPTNYYYDFDLPGHGKSSHLPSILPIHSEDFIVFYMLMVKHFGKEKYVFMGHSLGGQLCSLFARLYPHFVTKLILLETLHSFPISARLFHIHLENAYNFISRLNEKPLAKKKPAYTYEEALQKLKNQRMQGHLTEEAAKPLLERALVPHNDGTYCFSTDPRIKTWMDPPHDLRYITASLTETPFKQPVLILLGLESSSQITLMEPVINLFEQNELVTLNYVPGDHNMHMNNPELAAEIVTPFLTKEVSKL